MRNSLGLGGMSGGQGARSMSVAEARFMNPEFRNWLADKFGTRRFDPDVVRRRNELYEQWLKEEKNTVVVQPQIKSWKKKD